MTLQGNQSHTGCTSYDNCPWLCLIINEKILSVSEARNLFKPLCSQMLLSAFIIIIVVSPKEAW